MEWHGLVDPLARCSQPAAGPTPYKRSAYIRYKEYGLATELTLNIAIPASATPADTIPRQTATPLTC